MDILGFIVNYWDSILVVIGFIILIIVLIKRGEIVILKQILFNLVTKAEQMYGDGTGKLKYAAVADWLYQRIPAILKFLFTAKDIEKMIEEVLESAKVAWNTNDKLLTAGSTTTTTKAATTIVVPEGSKVADVVKVENVQVVDPSKEENKE